MVIVHVEAEEVEFEMRREVHERQRLQVGGRELEVGGRDVHGRCRCGELLVLVLVLTLVVICQARQATKPRF